MLGKFLCRLMMGITFCSLLACSAASVGLQALGSQVLSASGFLPGESVYDVAESWSKATTNMNREEEYYLGRAVSARILAQYPMERSSAKVEYLNTLGQILASYSDLPETFGGYHFALLRTGQVNALAAPGGNVFVTQGLEQLLFDEDMLAAVLAHEIAHIVLGHGKAAIQDSRKTQAVLKTLEAAGSVNCAEVIGQATSVFSAAVEDIVQTLLESGYSREQEGEADKQALGILTRAGYDPNALFDVFDALAQAGEGKRGGLFSTHPEIAARKKSLEKYLTKNPLPSREEYRVKRASRGKRFVQFAG